MGGSVDFLFYIVYGLTCNIAHATTFAQTNAQRLALWKPSPIWNAHAFGFNYSATEDAKIMTNTPLAGNLDSEIAIDNFDIFENILEKVVGPAVRANVNSFQFATITELATATGGGKDLTPALYVASTLRAWNIGKTILEFPVAGAKSTVNSLLMDACPSPPCELIASLRLITKGCRGNWSKGQNWSPMRAAIIGEGLKVKSAAMVPPAAAVLSAHAMMTIGFDSSDVSMRTENITYFLFARVDDASGDAEVFALLLKSMHVPESTITYWGCSNTETKDAQRHTAFVLKYHSTTMGSQYWFRKGHYIALSGENRYTLSAIRQHAAVAVGQNSNAPSHDFAEWGPALANVWSADRVYQIWLRYTLNNKMCPMFDFLSFAFPFVFGKSSMWISGDITNDYNEYSTRYRPQLVSSQSSFKNTQPFDGWHTVAQSSIMAPLGRWAQYKTWFKSLKSQPHLFGNLLTATFNNFVDFPSNELDQIRIAHIIDAAWAVMRADHFSRTAKGINYTIVDLQRATIGYDSIDNEITVPSFQGVTGVVFMPWRDRLRMWDIFVHKRTDCVSNTDTICDPFVMMLKSVTTGARQNDPSNVESSVETCLKSLAYGGIGLTKKLHTTLYNETRSDNSVYVFGCGKIKPHLERASCDKGKYLDKITRKCYACQKGRAKTNTTGILDWFCPECGQGTFASTTSMSQCKLCEKGKSGGSNHLVQCQNCALGRYAEDQGAHACNPCVPGTFSDEEGLETCKNCKSGTYQGEIGQTKCTNCAATLDTPHEGSLKRSSCGCKEGNFRGTFTSVSITSCLSCATVFPKLSFECSKFDGIPKVRAAFMALPGQTTIYDCRGLTKACKGGIELGKDMCTEGGSMIACSWCGAEKSWSSTTGLCEKCDSSTGILLCVCMVLLVVGLFVKLRPREIEYGEQTILKNISIMFLSVPCAQTMDFFQVQSIFSRSAVSWPSSGGSMFNFAGSVFTAESFKLACTTASGDSEKDAISLVVMLNMLPAILIGICALLVLPSVLFPAARKMRMPHPIGACNTAVTILIVFFITILNFSITLVLSTYVHAPTSLRSLVAFPYILTDDAQYNSMLGVAIVAVCTWNIGTFIAIVSCIYVSPKINNPTFHRCVLALTIRFRRNYAFFVIMELMTKFWMSLSVCVSDHASEQMQIAIGVQVAYMVVLASCKPYRFFRHTCCDICFSIAKLCVLYTSAIFLSGNDDDSSPILVFVIVMYALVICVCLNSLYMFLQGHAADPRFDIDFCKRIANSIPYPRQHPIEEVVPGLDTNSKRWSSSSASARDLDAQIVALDSDIAALKSALEAIANMNETASAYILENVVPANKAKTFETLVEQQRIMVNSVKNKSGNDFKQSMELQSSLVNQLVEESAPAELNDV